MTNQSEDSGYQAGDVTQVARRQSRAKRLERTRADGLRQIMATRQGRAWVWNLLEQARVFASSFDPNPTTSAFNEGQRNLGLVLLADIHRLVPEAYLQMVTEAREDAP
jgi:hypothetical protein